MILISSTLRLKVSGRAEIIDDDASIWDNEENDYIYIEYADIKFADGYAEVQCEIGITFDFDSPEDTSQVDSFKLISIGGIPVICKNVNLMSIDEEEMAIRCLREDMGMRRLH